MLLAQRSYVFVPCPVCQALRPTAKRALDTGQGFSVQDIIPTRDKYNNESSRIKMPQNVLRGLGVQACNTSPREERPILHLKLVGNKSKCGSGGDDE